MTSPKQLGCRVRILDEERKKRIKGEDKAAGCGHTGKSSRGSEAVNAGELAEEVPTRIKRHVVMSNDGAVTVALWVMFSWVQ